MDFNTARGREESSTDTFAGANCRELPSLMKRALMTHCPAFDEVADFLGEILGMVAGAFEGLRHQEDLQAERHIAILSAHLARVDAGAQ